jgi:putative acetyltransferase
MPHSAAPATEATTFRQFEPGDEAAFWQLNEEWISRHFRLEAKDEKTLRDPRTYILDPGGCVWFAVQNGMPVGCCALAAIAPHEYEVAKMAVLPRLRGQGVGRALLQVVIDHARALGARRLYLETSHILTNAIRLYESLGFRHVPAERITPSPYARADVFMEQFLDG